MVGGGDLGGEKVGVVTPVGGGDALGDGGVHNLDRLSWVHAGIA